MAIRLALLRHHYRTDWEWTDDLLWDAVDTVDSWRKALSLGAGAPAEPVVEAVLAALADDLDAPAALDRRAGLGRRRRSARPGTWPTPPTRRPVRQIRSAARRRARAGRS